VPALPAPKPSAPARPDVAAPAVPAASASPASAAAAAGSPGSSAKTPESTPRGRGATAAGPAGSGRDPVPPGGQQPSAAAGATAAREVVDAVVQVGGACRSVGRLVDVGVSQAPPGAAARPAGDAAGPAVAVAPSPARQHGLVPPAAVLGLPADDAGSYPAAVIAGLGGGDGPTDISKFAAFSLGVLLLALTAFAVYALAGDRAPAGRRLPQSRAARLGLGGRGSVVAMVALGAGLAAWGAITLWALMSGG
jgi:hypothetical protein